MSAQQQHDYLHEKVRSREASGSALSPEAKARIQHHQLMLVALPDRILLSLKILGGKCSVEPEGSPAFLKES